MHTEQSYNQPTRKRVAYTQQLKLCEFLASHKEVAVGFNKSTQERDHSRRMWDIAATILNSSGQGAKKSGQEWSKYWIDFKAKLKKKKRVQNSRRDIGDCALVELSELEKKFLSICSEDCDTETAMVTVKVDPLINSQDNSNSEAGDSRQNTQSPLLADLFLKVETVENDESEEVAQIASPVQNTFSQAQSEPVSSGSTQQVEPEVARRPVRRRQRRRRQRISAAEARERLVRAAELRAEATLDNSQSVKACVNIFSEMLSIMRRLESRLSDAPA